MFKCKLNNVINRSCETIYQHKSELCKLQYLIDGIDDIYTIHFLFNYRILSAFNKTYTNKSSLYWQIYYLQFSSIFNFVCLCLKASRHFKSFKDSVLWVSISNSQLTFTLNKLLAGSMRTVWPIFKYLKH